MMISLMIQMNEKYSFHNDYWASYWSGPFDPDHLFDFIHCMLRISEPVKPWELYSVVGSLIVSGRIPFNAIR
jgi:hypothetical protein